MLNPPLRVYVENGCPMCEATANKIRMAGIPAAFVAIGPDPVIQEGILAILQEDIVRFPIIVSFLNITPGARPSEFLGEPEVIVGFQEKQLERVFADYFAAGGQRVSYVDPAKVNGTGEPAQPPVETAPESPRAN